MSSLRARISRTGAMVRVQDLPASVRGIVYHDDDLTPFIIINAKMDRAHQLSALRHELDHIEHGQMYDPDYREYK